MNDYLVAFDIGSSKISAAMAKFDDFGKMQVTAVSSVKSNGINKSHVIDVESVTEAIKQCKEKLEATTERKVENVYVGFPLNLCKVIDKRNSLEISTEDGRITRKHISKVIKETNLLELTGDMEILDIVPIQYKVDDIEIEKPPVGMRGKILSVESQFYIIDRSIIVDYLKSIELAGLTVDRIIVQPLAIAALAYEKEDIKSCVSIINVGSESIDISVYQGGGIYYSRQIPIGGNSITKDISMCFNISISEAEKLKYQYQYSNKDIDKISYLNYDSEVEKDKINFSMLDEIIKARVEEFIALSYKELSKFKFFEYINCIYVAGGGIFYYRDIIEGLSKEYDKSIKFVSSSLIASGNPSYTVPLGTIKYVNENTLKKEEANSKEKVSNNRLRASNGIMTKVKNFLRDFF